MRAFALTRLGLLERRSRIVGLIAFGILFIVSGLTARMLVGDEGGHVELGQLVMLGGMPLVSAMLLLGWLLGRYPLIATLVLLDGVLSGDRRLRYSRIYAVRPTSLLRIYAPRVGALMTLAFVLSALLMPVFDVIMLGAWAGPATLVVIGCYMIAYSGLMVLLSVFVRRGEAWYALMLGSIAMVWDALRRGGALDQAPPGVREVVSFILPPQGALFQVETAFGAAEPIPWPSVGFVIGYGFVMFLAAAVFVEDREL